MDINELKKLIKKNTSVLVMDNGEPSFVLLGYDMYKSLISEKGGEKEVKITQSASGPGMTPYQEKEAEILERLNREILALKNQIEQEERGLIS
jgi:hypothetical protein